MMIEEIVPEEHDCRKCDGKGLVKRSLFSRDMISCEECEGKGRVTYDAAVVLDLMKLILKESKRVEHVMKERQDPKKKITGLSKDVHTMLDSISLNLKSKNYRAAWDVGAKALNRIHEFG